MFLAKEFIKSWWFCVTKRSLQFSHIGDCRSWGSPQIRRRCSPILSHRSNSRNCCYDGTGSRNGHHTRLLLQNEKEVSNTYLIHKHMYIHAKWSFSHETDSLRKGLRYGIINIMNINKLLYCFCAIININILIAHYQITQYTKRLILFKIW